MKKELTQRAFAKLGGMATLKKHGKKHYSEMGKLNKGKKKKKRLSTV